MQMNVQTPYLLQHFSFNSWWQFYLLPSKPNLFSLLTMLPPGGSLRSPPSSSPFSGLEPNCRPQLPVCSYWGWSPAPRHALWSWIVPPDCSRNTFEPEGKTLWSEVHTVYVTNTLNKIFFLSEIFFSCLWKVLFIFLG